jgi:hypothetical protein
MTANVPVNGDTPGRPPEKRKIDLIKDLYEPISRDLHNVLRHTNIGFSLAFFRLDTPDGQPIPVQHAHNGPPAKTQEMLRGLALKIAQQMAEDAKGKPVDVPTDSNSG